MYMNYGFRTSTCTKFSFGTSKITRTTAYGGYFTSKKQALTITTRRIDNSIRLLTSTSISSLSDEKDNGNINTIDDDDECIKDKPPTKAPGKSSAHNWPLFVRTIASDGFHAVARMLISQPLQPVLEYVRKRQAASEAVASACASVCVDDLNQLQDVCTATILAECIYKIVNNPLSDTLRIMSYLKSKFPTGLVTLNAIQFSPDNGRQRFAVAESDSTFYVVFMGTKQPKDYLANVNVWQEEVSLDASRNLLSVSVSGSIPESKVTRRDHNLGDAVIKATYRNADDHNDGIVTSSNRRRDRYKGGPAAHKGFLRRSKTIPVDALFYEAQKRGKRLVLCGHSLGGAIACLVGIDLLQRLPKEKHSLVSCIGFATPALGNEALARMVVDNGWHDRILNYLVPEDPISGLLGSEPTVDETLRQGKLGKNARALRLGLVTAPLRAARPRYLPVGRQLYVYENHVTTDKTRTYTHPASPLPVRGSTLTTTNTVHDDIARDGAFFRWPWQRISSIMHDGQDVGDAIQGFDVDDDDNDVNATEVTAVSSGIMPDRLLARTLFPMHRMLTYRSRLMSICKDALMYPGHHSVTSTNTSFFCLPSLPNPVEITSSELLAPGVFPVKAEIVIVRNSMERRKRKEKAMTKTSNLFSFLPVHAPRRHHGTGNEKTQRTPIDVIIKVDGRGLYNIVSVWVSYSAVGDQSRIKAEIIRQPKAPSPWQASLKRHMSPFLAPIHALVSWMAVTLGWNRLLRSLQKPGRSDFLLAKAFVPASIVKAAQEGAMNIGLGKNDTHLVIHLQSDFKVYSVPVSIALPTNDGPYF